MTEGWITGQIQTVFEAYLEAYFTRRDQLAIDSMLGPKVTGFGTGRSESTFND